jgi:hypothetical protein
MRSFATSKAFPKLNPHSTHTALCISQTCIDNVPLSLLTLQLVGVLMFSAGTKLYSSKTFLHDRIFVSFDQTAFLLVYTQNTASCSQYQIDHPSYMTGHPKEEKGRWHPPELEISRRQGTGCICSKKSPLMNSILSKTPYIFALCFAQEILIGSISIAMTTSVRTEAVSTFIKISRKLDAITSNLNLVAETRCTYTTECIDNSPSWNFIG